MSALRFDLYVWRSPVDLDAAAAEARIGEWEAAGADPAAAPFDATTDIGWFHRELVHDHPALEVLSDATPSGSRMPVWLSSSDEAPARIVAVRLPREDVSTLREAVETILGLATKYDLVVFDAVRSVVHHPLEELAAYASATFWPRGAIQAAIAGGGGGGVAVIAWLVGIPILSGVIALAGGFMFVMAVWSFVHEGRAALRRRREHG